MNKGSREGDTQKIETLGPFAAAFGRIIATTAMERTDIGDLKQKLEVEGTVLWRGGGYLPTQIQEYKDKIEKTERREVCVGRDAKTGNYIIEEQEAPALTRMTGFISTSLDKN